MGHTKGSRCKRRPTCRDCTSLHEAWGGDSTVPHPMWQWKRGEGGKLALEGGAQGCIRREGASEAATEAVGPRGGGGGDSLGLDANYPHPPNRWRRPPMGGGGLGRGVFGRGDGGGGSRRGFRALGSGRISWEGVSRRSDLGGTCHPRPSVGQSQAPLTSPCPPSNHTIILNLTLTFAANWFGHARHLD